jgi:hypothetical protein
LSLGQRNNSSPKEITVKIDVEKLTYGERHKLLGYSQELEILEDG